MRKPTDMIPPALLARLAALEARLGPVAQDMAGEAARVATLRDQLMHGIRLNQADAALVLRTAGTDTERQYWQSLMAAATG